MRDQILMEGTIDFEVPAQQPNGNDPKAVEYTYLKLINDVWNEVTDL